LEDVLTTDYDGCGRCLVATRRLSRRSDATSSPQRQADQDLQAAADAGGHIIAWADDLEVSGATNPLTRPGLGPWLRGEMGPYDGIVAASVDRVGRNVRDTLSLTMIPLAGHEPEGSMITVGDGAETGPSASARADDGLRACLRTQVAAGWATVRWRARRRVITMIMAQ
jgi:hypothetical protein